MNFKGIAVCLFFFVLGSCLKAQDYVYPALPSEMWGIEIFKEQEQQMVIDESSFMPQGAPSIGDTYARYEQNLELFNLYNDSIYIDLPTEDWVQMFRRRARTHAAIYKENNKNLTAVNKFFAAGNVPDQAYDLVYHWCAHMLYNKVYDIFLCEEMVNLIMPHYSEIPDDEHLVLCYLMQGICFYQCYRMGESGSEKKSLDYFRKALEFSNDFARFENPLNRYYLLLAYLDIIVLHTQRGTISMEESLELAGKMQSVLDKPESRKILDQDKKLAELADWVTAMYSFRAITAYISRGEENPALRDQLYALYCDAKKEIGLKPADPTRYYTNLEYDDCVIEAYMGHITWDEAYNKFMRLSEHDPFIETKKGELIVKVHYVYNIYSCFTELLDKTSLTFEQKSQILKEHIELAYDMLPMLDYKVYPYEIGQILSNIICDEKAHRYIDESELVDFMFRPFVMEQPTTFVHVSMVADLSRILATALVEYRPGFFIGVPGYETTKDVKAKKDELIEFIYQAALYHDFGKINMPTIIGNSYRRINDHEYGIIKIHPVLSARILDSNPVLKPYSDVAQGHHKWYNGKGYPYSFNNRQSPYFPIICLVTMCDCMDAATENISRNYHSTKTFERLMREYDDAAAAQYHQALLKFLNTHPETYRQMKACITEGRYSQYIELYKKYIEKHFLAG